MLGFAVSEKEATARIKINKLLEAAGWRFFPKDGAPANICLEPTGETLRTMARALIVRVWGEDKPDVREV